MSLGPQHAALGGYDFLALPPAQPACQVLRICILRRSRWKRRCSHPRQPHLLVGHSGPIHSANLPKLQPPLLQLLQPPSGALCGHLTRDNPLLTAPLPKAHCTSQHGHKKTSRRIKSVLITVLNVKGATKEKKKST